MTRTKTAFPFKDDEVVIARDGFIAGIDGEEVIVQLGSRHRSSERVVHAHPAFFVADGTPVLPIERPEIADEPPPPPRPKKKMLRSKRDWGPERRTFVDPWGEQVIDITLHEGGTLAPDTDWLRALTPHERKTLFEEIEV